MFIYGRIIARFPILKDVGAGNMFGSTTDNFLLSMEDNQIFCNIQKLTNIKLLYCTNFHRRISYGFLIKQKINVGIIVQKVCL
jgi:hypothetical protein